MAWAGEMVAVLRLLADDVDAPQKYTDARLQQTLLVAVRLVQADAAGRLPQTYEADPVALTLTPDPTADPRDEWMVTLACYRAAAVIDGGAAVRAAGQAVRVRDGSSEIDLTEAYKARAALLGAGAKAEYDRLLAKLLTGRAGNTPAGALVAGPVRHYGGGGPPPWGA